MEVSGAGYFPFKQTGQEGQGVCANGWGQGGTEATIEVGLEGKASLFQNIISSASCLF